MVKKRKKYSSREKVVILKRHLVEKATVSDLCDEYGIHPTVFYRWQKEFFEKGANALEGSLDTHSASRLERQVAFKKRLGEI